MSNYSFLVRLSVDRWPSLGTRRYNRNKTKVEVLSFTWMVYWLEYLQREVECWNSGASIRLFSLIYKVSNNSLRNFSGL